MFEQPTFSGLALGAFFSSYTDAVAVDNSYIVGGVGNPGLITQTPTASMSVLMNPFIALLLGASPASNGPQLWTPGDSQLTIPLSAPDATSPRIDLITAQVVSYPDPTTTPPTPGQAGIIVVPGTPAATPVEPTGYPVNSLILGRINVPAGTGAVITNSAIIPRAVVGGLRGGVVRAGSSASSVQTPPSSFRHTDLDRLSFRGINGFIDVPSVNGPRWYMRGVPASFTIPNATDKVLAYSTADKAVGVSVAGQTTGVTITFLETGIYAVEAGLRVPGTSSTGERHLLLEYRTSAGARIRRKQQAFPAWASSSADASVTWHLPVLNVNEQVCPIAYQSSGSPVTPQDIFGDWMFSGVKTRDL